MVYKKDLSLKFIVYVILFRKKLVKLKYFSLKTNWYTYGYDTQVVPLLNRMLNLEELTLYISVIRTESNYIDEKL